MVETVRADSFGEVVAATKLLHGFNVEYRELIEGPEPAGGTAGR